MSNEIKSIDVSISEDAVRAGVKEFFDRNPKLNGEVNQRNCSFALAYLIGEQFSLFGEDSGAVILHWKDVAKFLSQDTLHGLAGNVSQFKKWFLGEESVKKAKVTIDDLA